MTAIAFDTRSTTTTRPRRQPSRTLPVTPTIAARPTLVVSGHGTHRVRPHACAIVVPEQAIASQAAWQLTARGLAVVMTLVALISVLGLYTIVSQFLLISG